MGDAGRLRRGGGNWHGDRRAVYLSMLHHGHAFLRMLVWHVSNWCFWGLTASYVLRLGSRISGDTARTARVARVATIGAVLCGTHLLITAQIAVWIQPFLPIPGPTLASNHDGFACAGAGQRADEATDQQGRQVA